MSTMPPNRVLIINLLRGAAPERAPELSKFFDELEPDIELTDSKSHLRMEADKGGIIFDPRFVEMVWLFAFSSWRAIETYSPAVVLAQKCGLKVDDVLKADNELGQIENNYKARINLAKALAAGTAPAAWQWPADVPRPTDQRPIVTTQDAAAYDLACLSLAAILLHETKHVVFANAPNRPEPAAAEEIACDVFARSFLTERLSAFACEYHHDYEEVLSKRAFGLAIGALIIHEITPHYARWSSPAYPSVGERIEALICGMPLPADADFWLFAACLLTGIMRSHHRPLDIVPSSFRLYTEELITALK